MRACDGHDAVERVVVRAEAAARQPQPGVDGCEAPADPAPLLRQRQRKPSLRAVGGDADEWVPTEVTQRTVAGWKKAGGEIDVQFYAGANHGFMTGKPDAPYAARALERMKAFIRQHTT